MKEREYGDFTQDIIDCIEALEEFTQGISFETFSKDRKTIFAVTRSLEIIGEATKNLPKSLRDKYPNIPWKKMAAVRDKLAHGYFGIDLEILWGVAKKDMPPLKPLIQQVLYDMK